MDQRCHSHLGVSSTIFPLDSCHRIEYMTLSRSVKDAFGRGYSRMRSECGARARTDTLRTRAASGIMLTSTTTGPGGAFPGLGQAGAGNARVRARGPSLPGWGERTGSNVLPRPRKPGLELRPRAESPDGKSRGGTPIGERAPSLPSPASGGGKRDKGARRIARCGGWLNTSVGVPLPSFFRHCAS